MGTRPINFTKIVVVEPYAERLIGALRDHVLIFGARQLPRILSSYSCNYSETRTNLPLNKDAPLS
jgi:hypothetical protein